MRPTRLVLTAALTVLAIPTGLLAATLTVDLGALDAQEAHRLSVAPGDYAVEIRNRLPGADYSVSVEVEVIPIDALPAPGPGPGASTPPSGCDQLETRRTDLLAATDEKQVRARVEALDHELKVTSCSDQGIKDDARKAILDTIRPVPGIWALVRGERLTITVSRKDGNSRKQWLVIYSTGARGEWQTSYGFSFLPDGDEEFFLEKADDKFVVTRKQDLGEMESREDFDFAPGVFFTWVPRKRLLSNVSIGPTAGLGFDLDNPVVFAGAAFTWNQNLSLLLGGVMHQERRLAGRYNPGDELTENLDSDQLHESTYTPTWFVGVSFRFGSNPNDDDSGN